jgi:hypothetical protein
MPDGLIATESAGYGVGVVRSYRDPATAQRSAEAERDD